MNNWSFIIVLFLNVLQKPQEKCETKKQDLYHNAYCHITEIKTMTPTVINKVYAVEKECIFKKNQKPINACLKLDLDRKEVILPCIINH